jgi:hypothetical protein
VETGTSLKTVLPRVIFVGSALLACIEAKLLHPSKADSPMEVTDAGIMTDVKPVHPLKA